MIDLTGRRALVTGGSRGIGAATARLLAESGAKVAVTYRSHRPADFTAIQADLSRRTDADRAVEQAAEALGGLDILVANHGIWPWEDVPAEKLSDERWKETLAVNLDGVFFTCRAAIPHLRTAHGSTIVVVTSTAAQRGESFHADYAASKGALVSFVKSLAIELAPDITVNSVAPGWVDTDMSREPYERDGGKGREAIEQSIPLKRIATAEDVAGPILFLCSPLARHITGEILNVNGGSVLPG